MKRSSAHRRTQRTTRTSRAELRALREQVDEVRGLLGQLILALNDDMCAVDIRLSRIEGFLRLSRALADRSATRS